MEASTVTVHWHEENLPIYSVDFQPCGSTLAGKSPRLATAGGDNNIRLWNIQHGTTPISINYLSTLRKHTQAVNVVKFNREGDWLASAGDDGSLILWQKSDTIVKEFGNDEEDECLESWIAKRVLRSSNSEIYDISWSPDLKYIATGSMDNVIRIYDTVKGQIHQLRDHSHYVQGISWDPLNQYLATQSADRSVNIYELKGEEDGSEPKLISKSSKAVFSSKDGKPRHLTLYHSETLQSFFRRLAWSPDGSLLMVPLGIYREGNKENGKASEIENELDTGQETTEVKHDQANSSDKSLPIPGEETGPSSSPSEEETNSIYIYTRKGLKHSPVCYISGLKKPAIAISFSPILYEKSKKNVELPFQIPHKMVFAIATQDSVIIYDTEQLTPLGYASNLHYSSITDLVWDTDGCSLMVSSTDGFCSSIVFKENVFGKRIQESEVPKMSSTEETETKLEPLDSVGETPVESVLKEDSLADIMAADETIVQPDQSQPVTAQGSTKIEAGAEKADRTSPSESTTAPKKKRRVQPVLVE